MIKNNSVRLLLRNRESMPGKKRTVAREWKSGGVVEWSLPVTCSEPRSGKLSS